MCIYAAATLALHYLQLAVAALRDKTGRIAFVAKRSHYQIISRTVLGNAGRNGGH